MPVLWYALRSKARKEDMVWRQIRALGYELFYPRIRVYPINPRSKKFQPYFPGYLFIRADLEMVGVSEFQWMPHTLGLVTFGGEPAVVPENLVDTLRKRVGEIAESGGELFDGLKQGDVVSIKDGPFHGYEAIFDSRIPGNERVRVLLEFLGSHRRVLLELNASQISQVSRK